MHKRITKTNTLFTSLHKKSFTSVKNRFKFFISITFLQTQLSPDTQHYGHISLKVKRAHRRFSSFFR
nr:MAG TPA: hypothetical protein [Caudoviricetes sp.]